jgi:hypothetical protein
MKKQRVAGSAPAAFAAVVEVILAPQGGGWRCLDVNSALTLACVCKACHQALRRWLDAATADVSMGQETRPVPVKLPAVMTFSAKLRTVTQLMTFTYSMSVQLPVFASYEQIKLPPLLLSKQRCDEQCQRVLRGRQVDIRVAPCEGKGWGVLAMQPIEQGEFLGEYTGELVSSSEMRRRYRERYDPKAINYVLSLREHVAHTGGLAFGIVCTNVDASERGNWTRLVNHSCSPNAEVAAVRVDSFVPQLALFAKSRIEAGEELTFDYGGGAGGQQGGRRCRCGAAECREFLPAAVSK